MDTCTWFSNVTLEKRSSRLRTLTHNSKALSTWFNTPRMPLLTKCSSRKYSSSYIDSLKPCLHNSTHLGCPCWQNAADWSTPADHSGWGCQTTGCDAQHSGWLAPGMSGFLSSSAGDPEMTRASVRLDKTAVQRKPQWRTSPMRHQPYNKPPFFFFWNTFLRVFLF